MEAEDILVIWIVIMIIAMKVAKVSSLDTQTWPDTQHNETKKQAHLTLKHLDEIFTHRLIKKKIDEI